MRISLALAALLAALPFLFAEHRAPIPSFYDEWLGAALGTVAVATAVLNRRFGNSVPGIALWLVALAAWLGAQALLREPAYLQLPLAGIAYLLLAAQLAWLGHALVRELGAERVADLVAAALLAGAAANAAIGMVQFHGVPRALADFIATPAGPRIVGHVGHASLLAEYLALGQASLLYLVARGRLQARWLWLAGAPLVIASGCTQSRAALLFALWTFAAAFCLRRHGPEWRALSRRAAYFALGTAFAFLVLSPRLLDAQVIGGEARPAAWALAWRLFADSPWLGVGWGEFAGAAFRAGLPPAMAAQGAVWTSPHNLFLHVAAEAGMVGVALVVAALLTWGRGMLAGLREGATLPLWWVAALAGIIGLDALLQYPLWHAHVLALAALVAGFGSRGGIALAAPVLRGALAAASVAALALLAWTLVDYQRLDRSYFIASGRTLAAPAETSAARRELEALARGPLGAYAAPWLYLSLAPGEERAGMGERALRRWPSPAVIERASARRGAPPPPRSPRARRAAPPRRPPAAARPARERASP